MSNLHAPAPKEKSIARLCRLLGVSKQAYFKRDENVVLEKVAREEFAVSFIKEIRSKDPGIGGKKLWYMYTRAFAGNKPLGRDLFESVIDRYDLKVRKRVRKPRTTDSTHGLPVYPNLVKDFIPTGINQLWVSDITYIPIWLNDDKYVFCYLSLILDAYSEEIVGWSVGMTLEATHPIEALEMALKRLEGINTPVALTHHSDRGVQYASRQYVQLLQRHGIRISMTESGDPKDNAKAERINNTMKNELLKGMRFTSLAEVVAAVEAAVNFYNEERPHMSVDMLTPNEAAKQTGNIRKRWTSHRETYIKAGMNMSNTMSSTLSP